MHDPHRKSTTRKTQLDTLEAPQDTHGQDIGQGPPERNRQLVAKAEQGALEVTTAGVLQPCSNLFHFRDKETENGLLGHNKRSRLTQTSLYGQDRHDKIN